MADQLVSRNEFVVWNFGHAVRRWTVIHHFRFSPQVGVFWRDRIDGDEWDRFPPLPTPSECDSLPVMPNLYVIASPDFVVSLAVPSLSSWPAEEGGKLLFQSRQVDSILRTFGTSY